MDLLTTTCDQCNAPNTICAMFGHNPRRIAVCWSCLIDAELEIKRHDDKLLADFPVLEENSVDNLPW